MTEKITKQEFYYWIDYEQLKPEWLTDVMLSIINEENDQQSMSNLRSEIKLSFKDSNKCDCCKDSEEHEYHYWNENICEIEEDYTMPDEYGCVCYRCFEQLNQEGKIGWKK